MLVFVSFIIINCFSIIFLTSLYLSKEMKPRNIWNCTEFIQHFWLNNYIKRQYLICSYNWSTVTLFSYKILMRLFFTVQIVSSIIHCNYFYVCLIFYNYNLFLFEFFTPALTDGFSLVFEWQQVSSSLQDSSQYSYRSQ